MKIFSSRKLSDEELVNNVRKQLQKGKRWGWFIVVISGAFSILTIWFVFIVLSFFGSWSHDNNKDQHFHNLWEWYRIGIATGVALGLVLGVLISKVFFYFYEAITMLAGNRRDKLLVAYHDQLYPFDAKAPAPSTAEKIPH